MQQALSDDGCRNRSYADRPISAIAQYGPRDVSQPSQVLHSRARDALQEAAFSLSPQQTLSTAPPPSSSETDSVRSRVPSVVLSLAAAAEAPSPSSAPLFPSTADLHLASRRLGSVSPGGYASGVTSAIAAEMLQILMLRRREGLDTDDATVELASAISAMASQIVPAHGDSNDPQAVLSHAVSVHDIISDVPSDSLLNDALHPQAVAHTAQLASEAKSEDALTVQYDVAASPLLLAPAPAPVPVGDTKGSKAFQRLLRQYFAIMDPEQPETESAQRATVAHATKAAAATAHPPHRQRNLSQVAAAAATTPVIPRHPLAVTAAAPTKTVRFAGDALQAVGDRIRAATEYLQRSSPRLAAAAAPSPLPVIESNSNSQQRSNADTTATTADAHSNAPSVDQRSVRMEAERKLLSALGHYLTAFGDVPPQAAAAAAAEDAEMALKLSKAPSTAEMADTKSRAESLTPLPAVVPAPVVAVTVDEAERSHSPSTRAAALPPSTASVAPSNEKRGDRERQQQLLQELLKSVGPEGVSAQQQQLLQQLLASLEPSTHQQQQVQEVATVSTSNVPSVPTTSATAATGALPSTLAAAETGSREPPEVFWASVARTCRNRLRR